MLSQMLNSDLFNFPFQAGVWGTFSDWIIVIVTAITAVYLIKTFQSQKKVQELQLKATKIENEKYRIVNMPKFNIETITPLASEDTQGNYTQELTIQLRLIGSNITKVVINFTSPNSKIISYETNILEANNIDAESINRVKFLLKISKTDYLNGGIHADLEIKFTDPVGNEYIQMAGITILDGRTHLEVDALPTYNYN